MNKSAIAIIIYVFSLIFGALALNLGNSETAPRSLTGIVWTTIFLIVLFYTSNKKDA